MPSTLELETEIIQKLDNQYLTPVVRNEINSTIRHLNSKNYWFNTAEVQVLTTASSPILNNAPSTFLYEVMDGGIAVLVDDRWKPLTKMTGIEYDTYQTNEIGEPYGYTIRNGQILLCYTPDAEYTIKIQYRKIYAALVGDTDTNDWLDNAERLIKYHVIMDMYRDYRKDNERALEYQAVVNKELDSLSTITKKKQATGRLAIEHINVRPASRFINSNYNN